MGKGMSKVVDNLYVGSFADSNDKEALDRAGITHILTAMESGRRQFEEKTYLIIEVSDTYAENISQHFPKAIEFIHEQRIAGNGVLVHCMAGASRSVTLTVAYLATITGIPWRECLAAVRSVRRQANPNLGFQQQLDAYERQFLKEMRTSLLERYSNYHFAEEDEKTIRSLLSTFAMEANMPRSAQSFYDDLPMSVSVAQHLGFSPDNAADASNAMRNVVISPGGSAVGFTVAPPRSAKRYPPSLLQSSTAPNVTPNSTAPSNSNENQELVENESCQKTDNSPPFIASEQKPASPEAVNEKL